jgi:hypothetical protein
MPAGDSITTIINIILKISSASEFNVSPSKAVSHVPTEMALRDMAVVSIVTQYPFLHPIQILNYPFKPRLKRVPGSYEDDSAPKSS